MLAVYNHYVATRLQLVLAFFTLAVSWVGSDEVVDWGNESEFERIEQSLPEIEIPSSDPATLHLSAQS